MKMSQTPRLTQRPLKGPKFRVEVPEATQKKTFTLKESTTKTLARYAQFLSEHYGQKIDEDLVVESLVKRLSEDREFRSSDEGEGHA